MRSWVGVARSALLPVLTAVAIAACQPVDDVGVRGPVDPEPGDTLSPGARPGSVDTGMPATIAELLERTGPAARQWRLDARAAEISVELEGSRRWAAATVLYVSPDADRVLLVTTEPSGLSQERITLDTLEMEPLDAAALEEVPQLPADGLEPPELVRMAGDLLAECAAPGPVRGVHYTSGAPVAWDGDSWSEPPRWRATVTTDSAAVVLDPVSGEKLVEGCLDLDEAAAGRASAP